MLEAPQLGQQNIGLGLQWSNKPPFGARLKREQSEVMGTQTPNHPESGLRQIDCFSFQYESLIY